MGEALSAVGAIVNRSSLEDAVYGRGSNRETVTEMGGSGD